MREGRKAAHRGADGGGASARLLALFGGDLDGVSAADARAEPAASPVSAEPRDAEPELIRGPPRRPVSWRLDPSRRGAVAVLAAAVVAAGLVGWRVLGDRPQSRPVPATAQLATSSGPGRSSAASATARVVVDVVGKVRRPGLVRLPLGSRVDDALRAAGGAVPGTDLTGLNLARLLVDGEQIAVGIGGAGGAAGGAGAPGGAGSSANGSGGALVNLNTATLGQLDELPGVGPVLAQRIIDWRTSHGRFDSVDQLTQVTGVGDAKFADLKSLVTV